MQKNNPITRYRVKAITRNNERLMKQCFAKVWAMGMVSDETYRASQRKDYVNRV